MDKTSNARGDARGLVAKLAAHVRPTCSELWDEAQAFLAAEGVQAGEVECDCPGKGKDDPALHAPNCPARLSQQPEARFQGVGATQAAHELNTRLTEDRAILNDIRDAMGGGPYDTLAARIRKQQPEARGEVDAPSVDDLSRDAMAALLRSEKVYAKWSDLAADALAVAQAMRTALTGERNG